MRGSTRKLVAASLAASLMVQSALPCLAQQKQPAELAAQPGLVRGDEITPQQERAVQRGLDWLASKQTPEGNFGASNGGYGAHVAITSLGGLALMSAGNLPGRGKYGEHVNKAVRYVLNSSQESGLLSSDSAQGVMYGHGFATLFLAEVYGMTGDEEVKEKLQKAVRLIEKCQNPEGGWRYLPIPYDADISVTICQVMGLRAARDAGVKVEKDVIDRAVAYVRRCQNPDGGFSYMTSSGGGGSGFPRSAAGVCALYYAGIFQGDELTKGLDYVKQFTPGKNVADREGHYFYGHYYAVQAMYLAGGEYWAAWYPSIREELISRQDVGTGSWNGEVTDEYSTACALIILQMPNRYLPVFNGKGPGG